jgi:hypothetical protein
LKRRFRILRSVPEYSIEVQVNLVYALTAIHNYIRKEAGEEALRTGLDVDEEPEEPLINSEFIKGGSTRSRMDELRDNMAQRMWEDYINYISSQS